METWKDIKGYEGLYQVSTMGRVKSLNYNRTGVERVMTGIPRDRRKKNDYLKVSLGKDKQQLIHILVAEAFIPNPQGLPEVNHKDENKQNNCIENLEWCDSKYNKNFGTRNDKVAEKLSKVVLQYTLDNQLVREWASTMEIERQTGFANGNVSACCRGKYNTAYGYKWRYKE